MAISETTISVAAKLLQGLSPGMELGFGPGDFVLDGDPAPLSKRGSPPPNFRPMFIVAKRLDLAWR